MGNLWCWNYDQHSSQLCWLRELTRKIIDLHMNCQLDLFFCHVILSFVRLKQSLGSSGSGSGSDIGSEGRNRRGRLGQSQSAFFRPAFLLLQCRS